MSDKTPVIQDARHAATRIAQLLHAAPDDTTAGVDAFVAACSALPPGQTAIDLSSVLENHSVSGFRRLEMAALHRFEEQLQRLRPQSGSGRKMPRALAELQSAARAWSVSPLVLLVEFSHAPTSDNFWRLLSKLARSSRRRSWLEDRKRLHAARHRRCHDLFARRKGVSRGQPWAIPDVVSALEEQEPEPVGQDQEAGKCVGGGHAGAAPKGIAQPTQTRDPDDSGAAPSSLPLVWRRQRMSSQLSSADLGASGKDDDDEDANVQNLEDDPYGNDWRNSIQMDGSEHTSIWRISYGWWLPRDIIGRLCISLAQIQPNFVVTGVGLPFAAPVYQPDATLIIPLRMKMQHWTLATVCLPEKVISVYGPLASNECRPFHVDTDLTATLEGVLSTQRLAEGVAFAVSDCAIVVRNCPTQTKNIDSGVATIALSLYCLVGRAVPQTMDAWLWRRMLANYLAQFPSEGAAQAVKNVAVAAAFSANHTDLYEPTNLTNPSSGRCRVALRNDAMEGRAVWMTAARLAKQSKANAQSRQNDIACEFRRPRHAAESERYSCLEAVVKGIRAVLDDLDRLLAFLDT